MDKEEKNLSIIFHLFVIEFTLVKHKRERRLISFGQYRNTQKKEEKETLVFILVQRVWIKSRQ